MIEFPTIFFLSLPPRYRRVTGERQRASIYFLKLKWKQLASDGQSKKLTLIFLSPCEWVHFEVDAVHFILKRNKDRKKNRGGRESGSSFIIPTTTINRINSTCTLSSRWLASLDSEEHLLLVHKYTIPHNWPPTGFLFVFVVHSLSSGTLSRVSLYRRPAVHDTALAPWYFISLPPTTVASCVGIRS